MSDAVIVQVTVDPPLQVRVTAEQPNQVNMVALDGGLTLAPQGRADLDFNAKQFIGHVADGTAPIVVESTTLVDNLNADQVDGADLSTDATFSDNSDVLIPSQKAVKTALDLKAPLASPALTGTPTAPSAAAATDTTQVATTEFVHDAVALDTDYLTDFREWDPTRSYLTNEPTFRFGVPFKALRDNTNKIPGAVGSELDWEVTGGGAGVGENVGYSLSDQFEANVAGWNTYADAAGVAPVDGVGGTPDVTFARNATTPLVGVGDAVFTKDAANRQGQGVSKDFTIDRGKVTDVAQITFTFETSANYVDSDMGLYLYDVTNAAFIPISVQNLPATYGKPSSFLATFIPSTSNSYRLIFHVQSINSTAGGYTLKLDDVQVGAKGVAIGAAIGEWQSYTPSATAITLGTGGSILAWWRRNGSSMDIRVHIVLGTGGVLTGIPYISIPAGYTFAASLGYLRVGLVSSYDATNAKPMVPAEAVLSSAGPFNLVFAPTYDATAPFTWAVNDELSFDVPVPR